LKIQLDDSTAEKLNGIGQKSRTMTWLKSKACLYSH